MTDCACSNRVAPQPNGYDFANAGAMETRFVGTSWHSSSHRVRWRWSDEAIFHDLDGTFTQHSAGCKVLHDSLIADTRAYPECWQDARYGGTVCGPSLRFVTVAFTPPDPMLVLLGFGSRVSYYGERAEGIYVDPTDASYLLNKWRPGGAYFLVDFDTSRTNLTGTLIGGAPLPTSRPGGKPSMLYTAPPKL